MDEHSIQLNVNQIPGELAARSFTLVLVSHSHAPPLLPKPHLKFDLRRVSNPPKHVRDACDGRSKRLREHMMASDEFCALLSTAQTSVNEQMSSFAERNLDSLSKHPVSIDFMFLSAVATRLEFRRTGSCRVDGMLIMGKTEHSEDQPMQLIVGCFCELGRHRSVAFVEELSRRQWSSEWYVEVRHRDVDQKRRKTKNRHRTRRDDQNFIGSDVE